MTANVRHVLDTISHHEIFKSELYFIGGTALAYYLDHRISEDIDIISDKVLAHKQIISALSILEATKVQDENITALRLAGLFPDEYMLKFILNNVKLEFFQANRMIQKEILTQATFEYFENSKLKILDLKSVAKLKLVALIMREKSRDLFDFGALLEHKVLALDEIISLFSKINSSITSRSDLINFIQAKKEPQDDEAVYLNETNRVDLTFEEIKQQVIHKIKSS